MREFGDYIVFVDESGNHGLVPMDPEYPVFALVFCIFRKECYQSSVIPAVVEFKFRYFGHDQVVLHESEIRKKRGAFVFLNERETCGEFHQALGALVEAVDFTVVAAVIRKPALVDRYNTTMHPYHLAMEFGVERVCSFLRENGQLENSRISSSRSAGSARMPSSSGSFDGWLDRMSGLARTLRPRS